MSEQFIAWAIAQFGIIMFLIGYFHGRSVENKQKDGRERQTTRTQ